MDMLWNPCYFLNIESYPHFSILLVFVFFISYVTDVCIVSIHNTDASLSTRYEFHFGLKGQVTIIIW